MLVLGCLTTVTTTNFSTCRACGSSTVFCRAETQEPCRCINTRTSTICQCTLESQAPVVQHNGASTLIRSLCWTCVTAPYARYLNSHLNLLSGPHPSLCHDCASTSSSKNCTCGGSTVLWTFWTVGTCLCVTRRKVLCSVHEPSLWCSMICACGTCSPVHDRPLFTVLHPWHLHGLLHRLHKWDLTLCHDEDFDELQLLNLHRFRALSGPSAPLVAQRLSCQQPCSPLSMNLNQTLFSSSVEFPQCSA